MFFTGKQQASEVLHARVGGVTRLRIPFFPQPCSKYQFRLDDDGFPPQTNNTGATFASVSWTPRIAQVRFLLEAATPTTDYRGSKQGLAWLARQFMLQEGAVYTAESPHLFEALVASAHGQA